MIWSSAACARWQRFDTPVFIAGLCSVVMARLPEIAACFLKLRHGPLIWIFQAAGFS